MTPTPIKRFVSSNTCPSCNAEMTDVTVYGDVLVARCECGWEGSKTRKPKT